LGEVLTTLTLKRIKLKIFHKEIFRPELKFGRPQQQIIVLIFGTSKVRSLYRSGFFTTAARELTRYKLDLVGVQEVRWDKESTIRAGKFNFYCGDVNENQHLETGLLVYYRVDRADKRVEFVSDRMLCIALRDC
jgi:hypothetical protein